MQQDNNNIENKLRQLDSQQLPDLSHMDEHWQKMQSMLQPVPPKSGFSINNKGKLIGAGFGAIIIAVCFFTYQKFVANKSGELIPAASTISIIDTLKKNTQQPSFVQIDDTMISTVASVPTAQQKRSSKSYVSNIGNGDTVPHILDTPLVKDSLADAQLDRTHQLQQLMDQFIKTPQEFTINNTRDTVITAAEGSAVYIPANSLGGSKKIELSITEYYKKSDIILNQLNTSSNKDQLVTGGMLLIKATDKGKEVVVNDKTPLQLFMPDTSGINMAGMQLFDGDKSNATINWIPQGQYFSRNQLVTEVKVLNIIDQPYKVKQKRRGEVGYFIVGDSLTMTKDKLKKMLKEKYGYYKIRIRENFRDYISKNTGRAFNSMYAQNIGDSIWMDKEDADKYKLTATATKQFFRKGHMTTAITNHLLSEKVIQSIQLKYSVNITKLGWVNCDRFYADTRKKISYLVDLGDAAKNYYTMLIFDRINSMMTGVLNGNKVAFPNLPINEPVKIISIGINKDGETVYAVTSTTTNEEMLSDLKFEKTTADKLKLALSKLDQ